MIQHQHRCCNKKTCHNDVSDAKHDFEEKYEYETKQDSDIKQEFEIKYEETKEDLEVKCESETKCEETKDEEKLAPNEENKWDTQELKILLRHDRGSPNNDRSLETIFESKEFDENKYNESELKEEKKYDDMEMKKEKKVQKKVQKKVGWKRRGKKITLKRLHEILRAKRILKQRRILQKIYDREMRKRRRKNIEKLVNYYKELIGLKADLFVVDFEDNTLEITYELDKLVTIVRQKDAIIKDLMNKKEYLETKYNSMVMFGDNEKDRMEDELIIFKDKYEFRSIMVAGFIKWGVLTIFLVRLYFAFI